MNLAIWIISKYASPPNSISGQRWISLAQNFVSLGHQAVIISSRANHSASFDGTTWRRAGRRFDTAEFSGVRMFLHRTFQYRRTVSVARVMSWIDFEWGLLRLDLKSFAKPTHIIVSSLSLLTILNGYRLARKTRAKLIFEIRDIWPLNLESEWGLGPKNILVRVLRAIERFGYLRSSVVVGTMPNLAEHVKAVCGKVVKVECVGLGIDAQLEKVSMSYRQPLENESLTIGYAGSIGLTNSLENFLEVARQIGPNNHIRFDLWGGGDRLESFQEKYSSDSHIVFHGRVDRLNLYEAVKDVDVFFLAANASPVWKFGQSLHKVVEYMALGRPIIAEYSGYRSMIDEADCGYFVEYGDKLALKATIEHLRDLPRSKLRELGENGRTWIRHRRTYGKLAKDYLAILDSA